jgi:hypothetical protein
MKKQTKVIVGLAVASLVLSPLLILAQSDRICERITKIRERVEQRIGQKENQLSAKQSDIESEYTERNQERETALEQRREKWDQNREEHFLMLEEKAQTDEQKQAVTDFVQTITAAVEKRREAFDQAILDFQEGVGSIRQSRLGVLTNAISDYKEGVGQAFGQAEQECNAGNLRQDLKDIRDQYRGDIKQFEGTGWQIQDLVEAKKEAMNEAKDAFKAKLDQALQDLKASFPEVDDEFSTD